MKTIKCSQVLTDYKGKELKNGEENLTIGIVISNILAGEVSNPTLGWILGKKFATEDKVDLKAEEIVFLKSEIEKNKAYFAIVKGQCLEILEANDSNKKTSA